MIPEWFHTLPAARQRGWRPPRLRIFVPGPHAGSEPPAARAPGGACGGPEPDR